MGVVPGASLTAQYVVTEAVAFSAANAALATNPVEMLSRIRAAQRVLFTKLAERSREYFVAETAITSTSGPSGRIFDLSQLTPPLERVLQIQLATGPTLNQVDVLDQTGELAPRYYAQALMAVEVGTDWGIGGAAIQATLTYCYGPADLTPYAGDLTQPLSVPDQWIDILVGDLAAYLAHKDLGRENPQTPGADIANAQALADQRLAEFETFLDHVAGVRAMRLDVPKPTPAPK